MGKRCKRSISYFGISLFAVVALGAVFAPTPASASVLSTSVVDAYATAFLPDGASYSTKIRTQADATKYLNAFCQKADWRNPVAVVSYPSSISLNGANGSMSYQSNIMWRSCPSSPGTRAFAVTGYPQAAPSNLATCPDAGTYAVPHTYDCVKYTGSDSGDMQGYAQLSCPRGSNWACVSSVFGPTVQRTDKEPSQSISTSSQAMGGTVPHWSAQSKNSGDYSFVRSQAYCTYWKWSSNGRGAWGPCTSLFIKVAWVVADYDLTPSVTKIVDGKIVSSGNDPYDIVGTVENAGPTESDPGVRWQLTKAVYSGVPPSAQKNGAISSSLDPCQFAAGSACSSFQSGARAFSKGTTNAYDGTDNTGSDDIGKWVCYFMSVQPRSSKSGEWRHSSMKCVILAKSPKVNVLGGDLIVVGGSPTTTTVSTSLTTNLTAGRKTTYGSWVEYGIQSVGGVRNLASGAGLAGGVDGGITNICPDQSRLTFANAGCVLGGFAATPHSEQLQNRFKPYGAMLQDGKVIDLSQGSPTHSQYIAKRIISRGDSSGKLTITGGMLDKGQWVVINAPNMDVAITGDITYYGGALNSVKDIPQLVIIAKNINISQNVGRVDAWLVAVGTGANGSVSTCSEIPRSVMDTTGPGAITNAHSGARCTKQLIVNGPVIANHLYMYRTAGSGNERAGGNPAEVFNYRPDAYLWSFAYTSGRSGVLTVTTRELPPRF